MINANYIAVVDFKNNNPSVDYSRYGDTTLSGLISQSSKRADTFLGYTLQLETITDEVDDGLVTSEGDLLIEPRKLPIQSVSAIEVIKGSENFTLNLTNGSDNRYQLVPSDRPNRLIYSGRELSSQSGNAIIDNFFQLRGAKFFTRIDYVAGYQTIPADVKRAIELLTLDILATQYNAAGAKSISQGGVSMSWDQSQNKSKFVQDAEEILANYRNTGHW